MSVEAMSWVFKHSPYKLGTRLVHLALADVANDDHGWLVWASQPRLAAKAGVSTGTVSTALRTMVSDGFLKVVGTDNRGMVTYQFLRPDPSVSEGSGERPPQTTESHLLPTEVNRTTPRRSQATVRDDAPPLTLADDVPSNAHRLASEMLFALMANGCRVPKRVGDDPPDRWVKDFDALLRIDERPFDEVRAVLKWTVNDEFEKAVVLSPGKFRQRYDSLRLKSQRTGRPATRTTGEAASEIRAAIRAHGRTKRPEGLTGEAAFVVDRVGWGRLCEMSDFDFAAAVRDALAARERQA